MGKSKGRSARVVTEEDKTGGVQEFKGKLNVERAIFDRIYTLLHRRTGAHMQRTNARGIWLPGHHYSSKASAGRII